LKTKKNTTKEKLGNHQIFHNHMGLPSWKSLNIEVTGAKGIYLTGADGKNYIDMVSGVSVSNLGHKHPGIIKAVKQQATNYSHIMVYGELLQRPQIVLTRKLLAVLPEKLNTVYYVNSGSEAIEGAMKLAKRATGRSEIVAFKNAYHGGTHGALSILGSEDLKFAFRPLLPDIRQLNFNSFSDLLQISERTACVVVEPVQAEAGIILPAEGYLHELRKRCDKTGSLLVFDEIQMGMGRSGKLFCFENFNVVPDILCVAKAFGGGYPLGAFISDKMVMDTFKSKPELGHITTFGGHPVSCAAAIASLDYLTRTKIILKAEKAGQKIKAALDGVTGIKEIRQIGLMLGIEMQTTTNMEKLMNNLVKNLLIADRFLFNKNSFRIAPPLIVNSKQTELIIEGVKKSLKQL